MHNKETNILQYLYVLLSRSDTYFSRLISKMTPGEYTHASLALDRELKNLYSFGRFTMRPLPAGFTRENIHTGIFLRNHRNTCTLYRLPVSDEVYARAKTLIKDLKNRSDQYRYNLLGAALCKMDIPLQREYHYFCSQFVAHVLEQSGAAALPRPAALMRPFDLAQLDGLECVYWGPLRYCDRPDLFTPSMAGFSPLPAAL